MVPRQTTTRDHFSILRQVVAKRRKDHVVDSVRRDEGARPGLCPTALIDIYVPHDYLLADLAAVAVHSLHLSGEGSQQFRSAIDVASTPSSVAWLISFSHSRQVYMEQDRRFAS